MNKEEILAKSRQENKNRDIVEIDINKNASRISLVFSLFFILFLMLLTRIAGKHMNHGIIATEYSIIFPLFLYKAIKTKKTVNIICALFAGLCLIIFTVNTIRDIFDIYPLGR